MTRLFLTVLAFCMACSQAKGDTVGSRQSKPERATRLQSDVGIFSEFDGLIALRKPSWLPDGIDGGGGDADGDEIPDQLDILRGAKKADLNNAAYGSPYRKLRYPNGDVPRDEGVCTDVVARALRNAGIDLQRLVHEDIKHRPRSFPMVKQPNANIDHRRVKTLLPYFKGRWKSLPTSFPGNEETWLPGDVVLMQLFGDARPDHVGIVSDELGRSKTPLIINNWAPGFHTDAQDLLQWVPVTHRFRWAGGSCCVP